ncbi:Histidine kinase [Filimonas lacunae]|uniref:Oxygen sensor histidine kinase NreB n=2 Tax=Filimonas lacunae TaxID=477680 RepID=A0A1N7LDH0_9BACT|nr:Histidine kinase [Filimonas lacunae]
MHQADLHHMQSQYEHILLQSQLEIQEQTFRNISQEIHDNIGQVLSLVKLNLNTIHEGNLQEKLSMTDELVGKAISDLRDLSKSLNGEKIADIGLKAAIAHELYMIEKAASIHTTLTGGDIDCLLHEEQVIIVFRMVQELFNNILKHAQAGLITVHLHTAENAVVLSVKDDGVGFDKDNMDDSKTGIGLKNLQQRARLVNAQMTIDTAPGQGTEVAITLQPL